MKKIAFINTLLLFLIATSCVNSNQNEEDSSQNNTTNIKLQDYFDSSLLDIKLPYSVKANNDGSISIDCSNKPLLDEKLGRECLLAIIGIIPDNIINKGDSIRIELNSFPNSGKHLSIRLNYTDYKKLQTRMIEEEKYYKLIKYIISNDFIHEFLALQHLLKEGVDYTNSLEEYNGDLLYFCQEILHECEKSGKHNLNMVAFSLNTTQAKTSKLIKIINFTLQLCDLPLVTKEKIEEIFQDELNYKVNVDWNDYDPSQLW